MTIKDSSIKLSVLITFIIIMSLSACLSEWRGDFAKIVISPGGSDRAAYDKNDTATHQKLKHKVELTYKNTGKTDVYDFTGTSFEADVAPGDWNILIYSYLDGEIYAAGSRDVNLKLGQNNVRIDMYEALLVRFETNGGGDIPEQIIIKGGKIKEPAGLYKNGHELSGWYTDAEFSNQWNFSTDTVTGSITLHARWAANAPAPTFTSIADFKAWLAAQPENTAATAYIVKLNVSDLGGDATTSGSAGNALYTNSAKYVYLDLSGSTITSIGDRAFVYCTSLTGVTIPNSVTSIGQSAFDGCTSLASVTIPNSVTSIDSYVFQGCTSLASITIPNSVTSIGDLAFYVCASLASITIPDSVTSIGDYAFGHCTNLASVTIPNSVTSIGVAFGGCTSLTAINVDSGNRNYSSEQGVLYNKDKTVLYTYPAGKTGAFTIPNSVTSIGMGAFYGCTSLTSVKFEGTIYNSYFNSYAFDGNLRNKFYETNTTNGTPGTYTTTAPVSSSSVWTKQP